MSKDQRDATPPNVDVRQSEGRTHNPGATLQAARETQGLSAAEAAASLRLPEKILMHLEAGRFENLPGDTFARGYVRSYARLLGLDANQLVLEYDRYRGTEVRERQVSGIDKLSQPGKISGMLVTWTTVIVAIAILASILLWWYDSQPERPAQDVSTIADQMIDEVEVDALAMPEYFTDEPAESVLQMPEPLVPGAGSEEGSNAAGVPQTDVPSQTAPAQTASQSPVEPAMAEASSESPASPSGLQMSFTGNCWLQVTTLNGEVLHSALMQAGQSLAIDHQGPLDVVIGAVEAVSMIAFNGEPVDTQGTQGSGVVRLRMG